MNDLIQITQIQIGLENVNFVNSREVYKYLKIDYFSILVKGKKK